MDRLADTAKNDLMAKFEKNLFNLKNGMQVEIRNLDSSDAGSFNQFRKLISTETTHTLMYPGMSLPSTEETGKRLQAQADDAKCLSLGVFVEDKMIGYLSFRPINPSHQMVSHIGEFGMMILKEFWGQGLAQKLLKLQDEHAKKCGISKIEANVRVANDRGVNLYQRHGFVIEGTRKKAALIQGEFHDEYHIAKFL